MKNIKAIFFDWDNTLVDTWEVLLNATNATRKNFDLEPVSLKELKVLAKESTRESFPKKFGKDWEKAHEIFYKNVADNNHLLKIFSKTYELLDFIKSKNLKTALISNKRNDLLKEEVRKFNLESSFDIVLGSGDAKADKPAPDMGEIALKSLNIKAFEAVYLGDSVTDWNFAKNIGMQAIGIGDDFFDGQLLAKFDTPDEAFEFLKSEIN